MGRYVRIACATLAAASLTGAGAATRSQASHYSNAVVYWNGVATNTVLADSATRTPSAAALYVAIVQAAVYNATMAIEKTHQLYHSSLSAPPGSSVDAAVAAAAHDVLVTYYQSQQASLDDDYAAALAEIPDGEAKDDGVAVGRAAAAEIVALRTGDGRFAPVPEPPDGDERGEWRRTQPGRAVTPWVGRVRPFVVSAPDQFRPDGPNALASKKYATQWDEVRRYGAKTGSERSADQTEIARFWTENTVGQYNRAFRRLASERGLSVSRAARFFAMTALTGADGMITCWNTKFHYLFWRPVTAIRLADTDGNPATTADPTWEPFSATANHPEYTSGHACLTGAVSRAVQAFLGTKQIDLTMDAAVAGTTEHHFATVGDLRREVENARIYGGDHFRLGGSDGTKAGDHVAKWALKRFFRPTRAHKRRGRGGVPVST
jgi:hypothetical protein